MTNTVISIVYDIIVVKMGIYNQNILRINLNELVQTRASLQGRNLTAEEADDYANKLRRQLNWDSMFEQIDEFIKNGVSS